MTTKKYYGIRFPFTSKDDEKFFIDLENNPYQEVKSDLIHLLFTSTGQRIRNPNFGSKLINFIFEPNDNRTITDIKLEMQQCTSKYFPGITILELSIENTNVTDKSAIISIKYQIDEGDYKTFDSLIVKV